MSISSSSSSLSCALGVACCGTTGLSTFLGLLRGLGSPCELISACAGGLLCPLCGVFCAKLGLWLCPSYARFNGVPPGAQPCGLLCPHLGGYPCAARPSFGSSLAVDMFWSPRSSEEQIASSSNRSSGSLFVLAERGSHDSQLLRQKTSLIKASRQQFLEGWLSDARPRKDLAGSARKMSKNTKTKTKKLESWGFDPHASPTPRGCSTK